MLIGSHVCLRPVRPDDRELLIRWQSNPEIMTGWALPQPVVAHNAFEADLAGRFTEFETAGYFMIETNDGQPIGRVDFEGLDPRHGTVEVMLYIGEPTAQGKGYGADALRTLAAYLFHQRDARRIELTVLADNERAIRLYERVGFMHEGTIRGHVYFDGRYHDEMLMRLTPDALEAQSH